MILGSDSQLDNVLNSFLLTEAAAQKIQALEKVQPLNNFEKVLIQKKESLFDWNVILNAKDKTPVEDFDEQIYQEIKKVIQTPPKGIKTFLLDAAGYLRNNGYDVAFRLLFLSDIRKKYANTNTAVPTFESFVVGDLYHSLKNKTTFGNLAKLYQETAKAQVQETGQGQPNSWIVIPSQENDEENYEANLSKLMSYSSCKTGWCVRGQGMAESYLQDSDFHLYLDKDGDAVVSVRIEGEYVEEISGTENGSQQHVAEAYIPVTKEYFKTNKLEFAYSLESFDFYPTELVELLRGEKNYDRLIKYVVDGEYFEFYADGAHDIEEFTSEYLDEDKLIAAYAEWTGDEDDLELSVSEASEGVAEFLEETYDDFSVDRVYSQMYEWTSNDQMYKELTKKAQELFDSGQMEFVDPEETSGLLWRKVKPITTKTEEELLKPQTKLINSLRWVNHRFSKEKQLILANILRKT